MATAVQKSEVRTLSDLIPLMRDQAGFAELQAALRAGLSAMVDGAWGSSSALVAATLTSCAPASVLIVVSHPGDLDSWASDLTSLLGQPPVVLPAWENLSTEQGATDEALTARLRVLKHLGSDTPPKCILATMQALQQPVPSRATLADQRRRLSVGEEVRPDELIAWLIEHGFTRRETVELPGELAKRGGIIDVFPPDADTPFRLEFFGDELESIRRFAPETQRSLDAVDAVDVSGLLAAAPTSAGQVPFVEHLPGGSWVVLVEPGDLQEMGKSYLERLADPRGLYPVAAAFKHLVKLPSVTVNSFPTDSAEVTCHLRVESVERFSGDLQRVRDELRTVAARDQVIIACHNEAERQRLNEILQADAGTQYLLTVGHVRAGYRLVDAGVVVLSDHELFRRQATPTPRLVTRRFESRAIDTFLDLAEDDLVVHVAHGIARFRGMTTLEKSFSDGRGGTSQQAEEHLILEFAGGTKLYVPSSKIDLVQKYVGGAKAEPELSRLGGLSWAKRKERAQAAVMDLAVDMIELQALREAQPGQALPPDTEWQKEFEASFPHQETRDQLSALQELKGDMERARPMDRLICGDVGYGKTEVAIRAAFKTIDFGKQVAVLVPTTILAEQHYRTFSARLAEYPFTVECLSRFRTAGEQKAILKRLAAGGLDVVIGTHRLLSADVNFKDLGLVIIDEEQRFGVEHKDRLKRFRATVDVLTLTATPIPRTLHLSLLGIRDISNLETAPRDRLAIETRVTRFDRTLIRHAIVRELNRDGQVFFVHNRVQNIHAIANEVQSIVPEARIVVGHGQMNEHELEQAMVKFVNREADVLVATTIIESGLDIPNANTIFINQADQYGLADMHQLRGRVGRYKHRAYCYLLVEPGRNLSTVALRRLKAIEEFTELGAGFKIAMRDLEIRGAGNILGTQQSGHIAAVGYELYCQLLENAVRRMKNQPLRTTLDVDLDLPWTAYLPRDYVPSQRGKIEVYRRLTRIRKLERLEDFRQELVDRFGPIPEPADWLLRSQELRILAARWQVAKIHLEATDLVLSYRHRKRIERLASLSGGRLRVVDAATAYFRLRPLEKSAGDTYEVLKALLQTPLRQV